jgi:hypothetical protein
VPDQNTIDVVLVRHGVSSRTVRVEGNILQRCYFAGRIIWSPYGFYETTERFTEFVTTLHQQEGVHASIDGS